MSENLNKHDRSYVNVLWEYYNQVYLQLFGNTICISVQKIRGKIVCFGKCTDSLKVFKIFLSVKSNNRYSENFSWPRAHNPNSPHIFEHVSFDFSSENLVVCQDLLPSLMIIFAFNSSQLDNISMSTFSVEGKGIYEQQFLTLNDLWNVSHYLQRNFLKIFKLHVAACSIKP